MKQRIDLGRAEWLRTLAIRAEQQTAAASPARRTAALLGKAPLTPGTRARMINDFLARASVD